MKSHPVSRTLGKVQRLVALVILCVTCVAVVPASAQSQPPGSSPAQEGFVPIDQLQPREELPAAPFLMAAYSVAWLVIFGYVWSLWRRLSQVEDEIAAVRQQIAGGGRR
jgi:CcmD family protein